MNVSLHKNVTVRTIFILLGFIAGNAIWSLASLHPSDVRFDALIGGQAFAADLVQGEFAGVGRRRSEGSAIVADADDGAFMLRFTDFKMSFGPILHVWLVAHPDAQTNEDVLNSDVIKLGRLKSRSGPQAYDIPAGTDLSKYQSVVIWCTLVNSLFASAALN